MSRRAWMIAAALGAALAGCQGDTCRATYLGNYTGEVSAAGGCGTIAAATSAPGDLSLFVSLASKEGVTLAAELDLGSSPTPGALTSASVMSWQAVASANSDCEYSAGDQSVPNGNFMLTLTEVPSTAGGAAHGTLQLQQWVQAPPGTDCGPGDVEQVNVDF